MMFIKVNGNSSWFKVYVDGTVVAITPDIESALHAMWMALGANQSYTLEYESDTGIVHKRKKELPTQ